MRSLLLLLLLGTVLLMAAPGCYYDTESELYPSTYCDTTNVTYAQNVLPIIQANCSTPGCHVPNGTGPGDFTTYDGVRNKVNGGSFQANVFENKSMPPSSALSACDLRVLRQWVDAGAPNN